MPHVHKTTEVYTRKIEDTIEQLLERGALISRTLGREMEYARRPSRHHIPCSRSGNQSTTGATTVTYQPTQQSTKIEEKRLPCERVIPSTGCSSKITVATTTTRTEKRIVDPETNVEMRCYSVDTKPASSVRSGQEYKSSAPSSRYQQSTIQESKKTTTAASKTREVVTKSKEEREGWKKIFTHDGSDLLKGRSSVQECHVKTVIYQSNDPANKWLRVNQQWTAKPSRLILNLWTDVFNGKAENTWVNGKSAKK